MIHPDMYFNNPNALRERLGRWDLSFWSEGQKTVYIRKKSDGKLALVHDIAFISTQTRYTFYQRIPEYLFNCASGDANRLSRNHDWMLHIHLQMRHPGPRLTYQLSDRFYNLPICISPLSEVLTQFHRHCDWLCVPGTQAAFERAVTAARQCALFYDVAVGVAVSLHKAGCYDTGSFLCEDGATKIIADAHKQRAEIVALAPRDISELGPFAPLCEQVHEVAMRMIDNFISSHREYSIDRLCRKHLLSLGIAQSETVEFWLHCMLGRGEWLHHVERDPSCVQRLQSSLDEIRRNAPDTELRTHLLANLEYMVSIGNQIINRRSLLNQRLAERIDAMLQAPYGHSTWSLTTLVQDCPPVVDQGLLAAIGEACFTQPGPSAPAIDAQRLLRDEDTRTWEQSSDNRSVQLMGEILRRPTVRSVPLSGAVGIAIPCYDSWKAADFALIQDHLFAHILISRLERAGVGSHVLDTLWSIRQRETRLSRIVWEMVSLYPAELLHTARAVFKLAHQVASKGHPSLVRLHDELLSCLGGLTSRDPALFRLEQEN